MIPPASSHLRSSTSRREWLRAGVYGLGGLSLAQLLRLEAQAGVGRSTKAIINLHLDGGPSQYETIDPKIEAPIEIRGPFGPIETSVPGIQISAFAPFILNNKNWRLPVSTDPKNTQTGSLKSPEINGKKSKKTNGKPIPTVDAANHNQLTFFRSRSHWRTPTPNPIPTPR